MRQLGLSLEHIIDLWEKQPAFIESQMNLLMNCDFRMSINHYNPAMVDRPLTVKDQYLEDYRELRGTIRSYRYDDYAPSPRDISEGFLWDGIKNHNRSMVLAYETYHSLHYTGV